MNKWLREDFSDIDNLDRATESFMKDQRKALGVPRSGDTLSKIAKIGKRSSVFIVLGAILATAIIGGIQFGNHKDDAIRQPAAESSVSDTAPIEDNDPKSTSSSVTSKVEADASRSSTTKSTPAASKPSTVSTEKTTTSSTSVTTTTSTAERTTASSASEKTEEESRTTTTRTTPATTSKTTTKATTTTTRTTTSKATTTTTRTTTKATTTTTRTTTKATTTTTKVTTTTSATTTTKMTTTKVTTTKAPVRPNVGCAAAYVKNCEQVEDYYVTTVSIQLYNDSSAAANGFNFGIRCGLNGSFKRISVMGGNCSLVTFSTPNANFRYNGSLGGYGYANITLSIKSTAPITSVSYVP